MAREEGTIIQRARKRMQPFAPASAPLTRDSKISDGAKITYLLLDMLAGSKGYGWHSIGLIAELREVSYNTIVNHIDELEGRGLITVERHDGKTHIITVNEQVDVYGAEAVRGLFHDVHKISVGRHEVREPATLPKNCDATPPIFCEATPTKNCDERRVTQEESIGKPEPFGASSPSATPPSTSNPEKNPAGALRADGLPHPPDPAAPPPTPETLQPSPTSGSSEVPVDPPAPFVSLRGQSGMLPPSTDDEVQGGKKYRPKPKHDPKQDPNAWNSYSAAGYFRRRFMEKWPGEGAPEFREKDRASIERRLSWLKAEKLPVGTMKKVIDHIFDHWDAVFIKKFGWCDSRPGFELIESASFFEHLVNDARTGGKTVLPEDWKPEMAALSPLSGWSKKEKLA